MLNFCLSGVFRCLQDVAGLTDVQLPRRLGPKRANKIRKLFNLAKVCTTTRTSCLSLMGHSLYMNVYGSRGLSGDPCVPC